MNNSLPVTLVRFGICTPAHDPTAPEQLATRNQQLTNKNTPTPAPLPAPAHPSPTLLFPSSLRRFVALLRAHVPSCLLTTCLPSHRRASRPYLRAPWCAFVDIHCGLASGVPPHPHPSAIDSPPPLPVVSVLSVFSVLPPALRPPRLCGDSFSAVLSALRGGISSIPQTFPLTAGHVSSIITKHARSQYRPRETRNRGPFVKPSGSTPYPRNPVAGKEHNHARTTLD